MPNRKKQIIDLINQQIIDLTIQQYQQQTPVSNKGRKSTREAGKKQASNKPAVVNKAREAGKKQASNKPAVVKSTREAGKKQASNKPAVVNKARDAGKKQPSNKPAVVNKAREAGSKKQVRFNENFQETRYFYKKDPSQRMLKQNEFLNELQNKLKKSTKRVIKLKREISEECNNLKQKNGIYNPDQLALCDNLETMLYKKQTERKQIVREMKRIRKKLQESKENTK